MHAVSHGVWLPAQAMSMGSVKWRPCRLKEAAAVDWPLARQVLDDLGIELPEDEDLDQVLPAGDLSIFADLGIDEMDLGMLAGDLDLFPDEALAIIARKLGFGHALDRALDEALGR